MLGHTVADTLRWAIALPEAMESVISSKCLTGKLVSSYSGRQIASFRSDSKFADEIITLDRHEIEFLSSILPAPAPAVVVPLKSYGSCTRPVALIGKVDEALGRESSNFPGYCNSSCADMIGTGSVGEGSDIGCVDAAGALHHYYACNRSDGSNHRLQGDYCPLMTAPTQLIPHHSRATNAGGPVHTGAQSVPYSLAVEEIGMSAKVTASLDGSTMLTVFYYATHLE